MNFGDYDRALPLVEHAISLSPFPPFWYYHPNWQKYYTDGKYELALEYAKKGKQDGIFLCYLMLAATYAELGDKAQAASNVQKLLEAKPDIAKTFRPLANSLHWPHELTNRLVASLGKAGLPISEDAPAAERRAGSQRLWSFAGGSRTTA